MSTLLLRTSVRPQSQKSAVIKGTILAAVALCCLSLIEFILPLLGLESLGGWMWFVRSAILGTGLVPYQKVSWQKHHPDVLKVDEKNVVLCKTDKEVFSLQWSQIESFTFLDHGSIYGLAFTLKSSKAAFRVLQQEKQKDPETLAFLLASLEELTREELTREEHSREERSREELSKENESKQQHSKSTQKKPNELPRSPYTSCPLPKVILANSRKKYGVDIFLPYFTERSHLMLQQWYKQSLREEKEFSSPKV